MITNRTLGWLLGLCGAGLLLGATHRLPVLAPLQIAALAVVLLLLPGRVVSTKTSVIGGLMVGLGYVIVRIFGLELALLVSLLLLSVGLAYFCAVAIVWRWLAREQAVKAAYGIGAAAGVLEWCNVSLVPLFGTAQTFVLPWSSWPRLSQFVSVTGFVGLTFCVVLTAGLLRAVITAPNARKLAIANLVGLALLVTVVNWVSWNEKRSPPVKVAAVAYADSELGDRNEFFGRFIEEAAKEDVELLVFPEVIVTVYGEREREKLLSRLRTQCATHHVAIVFSYFDDARNGNYAVVINAKGQVAPEYQKTHLVPIMERYNVGDGDSSILVFDRAESGSAAGQQMQASVMICQDDNFTDLSRRASKGGAQLVAVPTLDWESVHEIHLQNSIWRAIESDYAVVRAAGRGTSAIISPRGEVVESLNHYDDPKNARMITAEVQLGHGRTAYALWGDFPMLAVCLCLAAWVATVREGSCVAELAKVQGDKVN